MAKKIPKIVREIRANPPQEINYAFQKNISHSQMNIFRSCPHRWKLQYKDKIKVFNNSIHTVFGSAIHETLQEYLTLLYNDSAKKADEINLEENFKDKFIGEYQVQYKKNKDQHFSSADEMREFYEDGVGILDWFKKRRNKYFTKRGWHLVGCEIPITIAPNKMYNNILYLGYLDVVLYNEKTQTFKIIDIKTSTRGWNAKNKKDEEKQFQLLLYKQFFAEQYGIPLSNIDIEFFIVKRKVMSFDDDNIKSPHQAYRVQQFTPPNGKIKLGRAKKAVDNFIKECFNSNGQIKEAEYPKSVSKWNCGFCPFKTDKERCGEGIIY